MHDKAINIEGLFKSYGSVRAIEEITLSVEKGELFGLIGPDGAGKTTLFRILTSLLIPDEGNACLQGFDVVKDYKEIRKIVGYMPGRFSLYYDLSVEENLNFFATIFGTTVEENYDLIKDIYIQIEPFKSRKAGNLSGGMKQKLALSCALIHKPEVLILDEPTTGVDAVSRKEFWEMLKKLKDQGITIIVSTPYMDEAGMCDRVGLIQKGKILQINTPENIVNEYGFPMVGVKADDMYRLLDELRSHKIIKSAHRFGDSIHTTLTDEKDGNILLKYLKEKGYKDLSIENIVPNIEDCFMALMTNENE